MNEEKGSVDPEIDAMSGVLSILQSLDPEGQRRVLSWACKKIGVDSPTKKTLSASRGQDAAPPERPRREGTVDMVCVRLSVKSCRDLFIACAAHFALYEGRDRFSRKEWIERARSSKSWKSQYTTQTATAIGRLLASGFVNETSKDEFAIPDERLNELEMKLNG